MTFHDPRLAKLTYGHTSGRLNEEQLITSHLPLVRKLAWHIHGRMSKNVEIEDLLQIGTVALVEAARIFEDRGLGFSNYAKLRVRGAMVDYLRKVSTISRSAMVFRQKYRKTVDGLSQQLGRIPSEPDIADAMGMDAESYRVAMDQSDGTTFQDVDEVYSDHSIWFADTSEAADEAIERSQMQEELTKAIADLPEREAMVLQLYFVEELNLDEIGKTLNIGAARVCQVKKSALEKVRYVLKDIQ